MTFNNGDQVPAYGNENPAEGGNVIVHPKDISLAELPAGSLFSYKGTIALKSEYRTDEGAIQAYIVGTGEMFWGGTDSINDLAALIVTPMPEIIEYSPSHAQGIKSKEEILNTQFEKEFNCTIHQSNLAPHYYPLILKAMQAYHDQFKGQSQSEQKTLAELLKSNPEAVKETRDIFDKGYLRGADEVYAKEHGYTINAQNSQEYFKGKFGLTI